MLNIGIRDQGEMIVEYWNQRPREDDVRYWNQRPGEMIVEYWNQRPRGDDS